MIYLKDLQNMKSHNELRVVQPIPYLTCVLKTTTGVKNTVDNIP